MKHGVSTLLTRPSLETQTVEKTEPQTQHATQLTLPQIVGS